LTKAYIIGGKEERICGFVPLFVSISPFYGAGDMLGIIGEKTLKNGNYCNIISSRISISTKKKDGCSFFNRIV
jgi:hypothetical protein